MLSREWRCSWSRTDKHDMISTNVALHIYRWKSRVVMMLILFSLFAPGVVIVTTKLASWRLFHRISITYHKSQKRLQHVCNHAHPNRCVDMPLEFLPCRGTWRHPNVSVLDRDQTMHCPALYRKCIPVGDRQRWRRPRQTSHRILIPIAHRRRSPLDLRLASHHPSIALKQERITWVWHWALS